MSFLVDLAVNLVFFSNFSKSKLKLNHKSFKAGADIKEIQAIDTEAAQKRRYLEDLCNGLQAVRKPLIAAVEGMAVNITLNFSCFSPYFFLIFMISRSCSFTTG
jgi:hypothetical protein